MKAYDYTLRHFGDAAIITPRMIGALGRKRQNKIETKKRKGTG